ncbi:hypothetical protein PMAYCL1PPCAC_11438, partial [Pristionchus mayeri]
RGMNLCVASDELKQKYLDWTPSAVQLDDIIYPGNLVSSESILSIKEMKFDQDDIVICCYPKSGRTWVSEILSALAHDGDIDLLRSIPLVKRVKWLEWIGRTPNGPHSQLVGTGKKRIWATHLPLRQLPFSILEGKCKLLNVARNPKDQAVSYFHMHRISKDHGLLTGNPIGCSKSENLDLTWDEFFRLHCSGSLCWGSWFDHVMDYWHFARNNSNAKFIFYEDMKGNLMEELKSIEDFTDMHLSTEKRERLFDHCSFDSMKENKMTNKSASSSLDHTKGKFMRKGIVGDWKNYFTVAQSEAFDELYKTKMEEAGLEFKF